MVLNSQLMSENYNDDLRFKALRELFKGENREWTVAYSEFNMQYTIILVAFIITGTEIVYGFFKIFREQAEKNELPRLTTDPIVNLFGILSVAFIIWAFFTILYGGLVSPENVELLIQNEKRWENSWLHRIFGIVPPPWKFFYPRLLIGLYNGFFIYFILKRFKFTKIQ